MTLIYNKYLVTMNEGISFEIIGNICPLSAVSSQNVLEITKRIVKTLLINIWIGNCVEFIVDNQYPPE